MTALDAQAAYHLAAAARQSLLLWDLRAGPAAAATLPLQGVPRALQAMPQGQVLLTADSNGQVCLLSGRLSRIVSYISNFALVGSLQNAHWAKGNTRSQAEEK